MDKEKYKNLIETLPKESEELWFEYNLEVNKILQENKKYKEVIDKAINDLNIIIDIVREQPLGSDCWIIDRLEANKSILKEVE